MVFACGITVADTYRSCRLFLWNVNVFSVAVRHVPLASSFNVVDVIRSSLLLSLCCRNADVVLIIHTVVGKFMYKTN